jgi:hypothetical protein
LLKLAIISQNNFPTASVTPPKYLPRHPDFLGR